jgi:hypothetical protein
MTVLKSVSLNRLEPSGPVQASNGIAFTQPNIWYYSRFIFDAFNIVRILVFAVV